MTPPQKAALIDRVNALIVQGVSLRGACADVGQSPATVLRWRAKLIEHHEDAFAAFGEKKPTGRPASVVFTEADLPIARWHRLTKSSIAIAVHFYCLDSDASEESVAGLRRIEERALENKAEPNWPTSVARAFHVTDDEKARFRSKKAVNDTEMVTRRGHFYIDENDELQELLPGYLWELDDYSTNQPYTYRDPLTRVLGTCRQVLGGLDVAGAGWLGFDMIGRERDAYRGEDIVRFIGRLFRAHGIPRILRLEKGSWESSYVHGIDVDGIVKGWGSLDHLCHIDHTWKSKGKGTIESSFNPLQNWLGHASLDVGRYAGEYDVSSKAMRQIKGSKTELDPRDLGCWSQSECATGHEEAARLMNSRPRTRKGLGERVSHDDLVARHGWHTTPLPAAEAWRLLPHKACRVLKSGHVSVNPGGGWGELTFVVNGIEGLTLENGHKLLIACDPADPAAGAYVCNADRTPKNRNNWPIGHLLLAAAPVVAIAPQINLSGKRHHTIDRRRAASAAAATDFRAITAGGAPGKREVAATNGQGASATAGTLDPLDRPAPKPAADPRPAGRQGLAPSSPGTARHLPRSASPSSSPSDAAALFGDQRAAQLAAAEAAAAAEF